MTNSSLLRLGGLAFLCGALALSSGVQFQAAEAGPPEILPIDVTVVNDASQPVPVTGIVDVNVTGTQDVNVTNTPLPVSGNLGVSVIGTPNVSVTNTPNVNVTNPIQIDDSVPIAVDTGGSAILPRTQFVTLSTTGDPFVCRGTDGVAIPALTGLLRQFPNGTVSAGTFKVPIGQVFVITSLQWRVRRLELPLQTTISVRLQNSGNGLPGPVVVISNGITFDPFRSGLGTEAFGSETLPTGVVIGPERTPCLGDLLVEGSIFATVQGYLAPAD